MTDLSTLNMQGSKETCQQYDVCGILLTSANPVARQWSSDVMKTDTFSNVVFHICFFNLGIFIKPRGFSQPGPRINIKTVFPRYGDSHFKDNAVARPSYVWHGNSYTVKTTFAIETVLKSHELPKLRIVLAKMIVKL